MTGSPFHQLSRDQFRIELVATIHDRALNAICQVFNHGDTPEFVAISAVALRHNDISNVLTTAPGRLELMHRRKPNGDVDPCPWCQGFYAAMGLRMSARAPLLDASNVNHGLLLSILLHCRDDKGRPLLGPPQTAARPEISP